MQEQTDAEQLYRARKRRREELEHAKRTSDDICKVIGLPGIDNWTVAHPEFPGLQEARRLETEALEAWGREVRA